MIPVWNLQTYQLIVKLNRHAFSVSAIEFSPITLENNDKYLISTSADGFMFFWKYNIVSNQFDSEPKFRRTKYDNYRAHKMCTAFSSGGLLIAVIHTFETETHSPSKPKSKKEVNPQSLFQSAIRVFSLSDDSGPAEVWKQTHFKTHDNCDYSLKFCNKSFRFVIISLYLLLF